MEPNIIGWILHKIIMEKYIKPDIKHSLWNSWTN